MLMKATGLAGSSVRVEPKLAPASDKVGPLPARFWTGSPARDPRSARAPSTGVRLLWELRARQGLWFLSLVQVLGEIFQ